LTEDWCEELLLDASAGGVSSIVRSTKTMDEGRKRLLFGEAEYEGQNSDISQLLCGQTLAEVHAND
jgi:hypothetical protein